MVERRSPFYNSIVGLGATMGRVGGEFISAKYYSGIADEHLNTRKNVGVQDLSTMGKMDIKGPEAEALVNHVIVNDAAAMKPGRCAIPPSVATMAASWMISPCSGWGRSISCW